jgi:hypothetical protein
MDEKSTYSNNIEFIMKFIIGFSRARSCLKIGSKIIQLVEARNFSHAYVKYIDSRTNIEVISQASHGIVNLVNSQIFIKDNILVEEYEIECSEEQFKKIELFIYSNLGKPYSEFQLALIGVKKIFHFTPKIKNHDEAFICSEWAKRVCEIANVELSDMIEDDYVTPSDLNTMIKNISIAKRIL